MPNLFEFISIKESILTMILYIQEGVTGKKKDNWNFKNFMSESQKYDEPVLYQGRMRHSAENVLFSIVASL